jgi:hypothetical protein
MKIKYIVFLFFLFLISCSKSIEFDNLEELNNGLVVLSSTHEPYTGKFISTNDKGIVELKGQLINGRYHGKVYVYLDDGTLIFTESYKKGIPHGTTTDFDYNGELQLKQKFKNGKLVKTIIYQSPYDDSKNIFKVRYRENIALKGLFNQKSINIIAKNENLYKKNKFILDSINSLQTYIEKTKFDLIKFIDGDDTKAIVKEQYLNIGYLINPNERVKNSVYLFGLNGSGRINYIKLKLDEIVNLLSTVEPKDNFLIEQFSIIFDTSKQIDITGQVFYWEDRNFRDETLISNLYILSKIEKDLAELKYNLLKNR